MWSKLEYVDVWYSVPQPADAERVASQRWHRDYDDQHLLKAFLYLVDVDEETGPFEYVPGSAARRAVRRRLAVAPLGENYPSQEELAKRVPTDGDQDVHGTEGDDHLLQHERLPPRRLRDGQAARARDRHVLVAGVARLAHRAELHAARGRASIARVRTRYALS